MARIPEVRQGESFDFAFNLDDPDASISGWACTIEVRQHTGEVAILSRVITPTGNTWQGFLTQTETAPLSVGLHYLTARIAKASTDEEQQKTKRFSVAEKWI